MAGCCKIGPGFPCLVVNPPPFSAHSILSVFLVFPATSYVCLATFPLPCSPCVHTTESPSWTRAILRIASFPTLSILGVLSHHGYKSKNVAHSRPKDLFVRYQVSAAYRRIPPVALTMSLLLGIYVIFVSQNEISSLHLFFYTYIFLLECFL